MYTFPFGFPTLVDATTKRLLEISEKRTILRHALWIEKSTPLDKMRACAMMAAQQQNHGTNLNVHRMWFHDMHLAAPKGNWREEDLWKDNENPTLKNMMIEMNGHEKGSTNDWLNNLKSHINQLDGDSDTPCASPYCTWVGALDDDLVFASPGIDDVEFITVTESRKSVLTFHQTNKYGCDVVPTHEEIVQDAGARDQQYYILNLEQCKKAAEQYGYSSSPLFENAECTRGCTVNVDDKLGLGPVVCFSPTGKSDPTGTEQDGRGQDIKDYKTVRHLCRKNKGAYVANVKNDAWWEFKDRKKKMCSMPPLRRAAYCKAHNHTGVNGANTCSNAVGCSDTGGWPFTCQIDSSVITNCDKIWTTQNSSLAESMPEMYQMVYGYLRTSSLLLFEGGLQLDRLNLFKLKLLPTARPITRLFNAAAYPKQASLEFALEGLFRFKYELGEAVNSDLASAYQCKNQKGEVPLKVSMNMRSSTPASNLFFDPWGEDGKPKEVSEYTYQKCDFKKESYGMWPHYLNALYHVFSPSWQTADNRKQVFLDPNGKVEGLVALTATKNLLHYIDVQCKRDESVNRPVGAAKLWVLAHNDDLNAELKHTYSNDVPATWRQTLQEYMKSQRTTVALPQKPLFSPFSASIRFPDVNIGSVVCLLYGVDPEFSLSGVAPGDSTNCGRFARAVAKDDWFSFDPSGFFAWVLCDILKFFEVGIYGTTLRLDGAGTGCMAKDAAEQHVCTGLDKAACTANGSCEYVGLQHAISTSWDCGLSVQTTINIGLLGAYPVVFRLAKDTCKDQNSPAPVRLRRDSISTASTRISRTYERHQIKLSNSTAVPRDIVASGGTSGATSPHSSQNRHGRTLDEYLVIGASDPESPHQWRRRRSAGSQMALGIEVTSLEDTFTMIFGDEHPQAVFDFMEKLDSFIPPSIDAAIIYTTYELAAGTAAIPGVYVLDVLPSSYKIQPGLTVVVSVSTENGCTEGDEVCKFVTKTFGAGAGMFMSLGIGSGPSFSASVGLGGIAITKSNKCPLGQANCDETCGNLGINTVEMSEASVFFSASKTDVSPYTVEFGLRVAISFELAKRGTGGDDCLSTAMLQPLTFVGELSVISIPPGLKGTLLMDGVVYKALGMKWLHFADLGLSLTISSISPVPSAIEAAGTFALGRECYEENDVGQISVFENDDESEPACLRASVAFGYDSIYPLKTYFSATLEGFNVGTIFRISVSPNQWDKLDKALPAFLKNTGFVGDASLSYAASSGLSDLFGNPIPPGLRINGTVNVFGLQASMYANIDPTAMTVVIDINIKPFKVAGGLLELGAAGPDGCVADAIPLDQSRYDSLMAACAANGPTEGECLVYYRPGYDTPSEDYHSCKWNAEGRGPRFFVNASLGIPEASEVDYESMESAIASFNPYIEVLIQGRSVFLMQETEVYMSITNSESVIEVSVSNMLLIEGKGLPYR